MRKSVLMLATAFLLSSGMLASLRAQSGTQTNQTTTTTTTRDAQAPAPAPPPATSQTTTVQTTTQQVNATQTWMGKIDKKDDQYLLEDKDKRASYKLDDASKADKFSGDTVKVTGTLDAATNMIKVQTIEKVND